MAEEDETKDETSVQRVDENPEQSQPQEATSRNDKEGEGREKKLAQLRRPVRRLASPDFNFNPCACFSLCCGRRFTLPAGCYLIGAALFISGLTQVLMWLTTSAESIKGWESTTFGKKHRDLVVIYAYLHRHPAISAFVWIESIFFGIISGIIIVIAAVKLQRTYCCVFVGFTGVTILWTLITRGVELELVENAKLNLTKRTESLKSFALLKWSATLVALSVQIYFLLCGMALWKYIIDGNYDLANKVSPGEQDAVLPPEEIDESPKFIRNEEDDQDTG